MALRVAADAATCAAFSSSCRHPLDLKPPPLARANSRDLRTATEYTAVQTSGLRVQGGRGKVATVLSVEAEEVSLAEDPEVLAASWEILNHFNKNDVRGRQQESLTTESGRAALRGALQVAAVAVEAREGALPLLGLLANSITEGVCALEQWTAALNCEMAPPISKEEGAEDASSIRGPVYIKYNARSKFCYVTQYTGPFRGVIVQLGQQQVGHLPLRLFDEAGAAEVNERTGNSGASAAESNLYHGIRSTPVVQS